MATRVFSLNGGVGAGFAEPDLVDQLIHNGVTFDLIANDAGTMDGGPSFLATGDRYYSDETVLSDLGYLVRLMKHSSCPLIIGSAGQSGDTGPLQYVSGLLGQVLAEHGLSDLRVAIIDAHVDPQAIVDRFDQLVPLGTISPPAAEAVLDSRIVGQMGSDPIITALEAGADVVLCGRACDCSVFAAGLIFLGIDAGTAHHVGHVMECGGMGLTPSNGLSCIISEVEQGTATFWSPSGISKATVASVAAHSLYEEDHVALQTYPEGTLTMQKTEYFAASDTSAGFRGSQFVKGDYTLKLEGARQYGSRTISLIPCKTDIPLGSGYSIYGKNGIAPYEIGQGQDEYGIYLRVDGSDGDTVSGILTAMEMVLDHYGYSGSVATAGNVAYPFSPSSHEWTRADNTHSGVSISGVRDPLFFAAFPEISNAILAQARKMFPDSIDDCTVALTKYNKDRPLALIQADGDTPQDAQAKHDQVLAAISDHLLLDDPNAVVGISAGSVSRWTLFHQLTESDFIKDELFKIVLNHWDGHTYTPIQTLDPVIHDFGVDNDGSYDLDTRTLFSIQPQHHGHPPEVYRPMLDMAPVIRTKDAGAGILTYDILFKTEADYRAALASGLFDIASMARLMDNDPDSWVGCSQLDACWGMKLAVNRVITSGDPGDRDVLGAEEQVPIEQLSVPIY